MALADKFSPGDRHKLTGANSGSISGSFASGKHLDLQVYEGEAALLYQIQTLQEDIDEIRRYIVSREALVVAGIARSLPTSDPQVSGSLWVSGSSDGADISKYLMVSQG